MVMGILNLRLKVPINFQDTLRGFHNVRVTGVASLRSNLLQQLMEMMEKFLCEIFLYLNNSYDTPDHGRCLDILAVYVVGPRALLLLQRYWYRLLIVARSGG